MKVKSLLLLLVLFVATTVHAQTWEEVVYLKNGSVIHGMIIEQIPNVSLRIQTRDGNIFAYAMDEVEKITKEQVAGGYSSSSSFSSANDGSFGERMKENGLPSGYRGFVDIAYSAGVGDYGKDRVELSTSHGYQVIPYLFVGAGAGIQYWFDWEYWEVPIFLHLRGTLPVSHVAQPFVDWKIGYSVGSFSGFYMSPAVGCRFAMGSKAGFSVSLGYSMQQYKNWWGSTKNSGAFTVRVGFDW